MNPAQLLQHFDRISDAPDAIPRLRRFILDLAVRGKLVEQDPADEPASKLLERIAAEKARLVKAGVIKKSLPTHRLDDCKITFPLPKGWVCTDLGSQCTSISDGDHQPPPKADSGIPFLVIGNVRTKQIQFDGCRHVSETYFDSLDNIRRPQRGDVLYTLVGSYGIPITVLDDRPFCVQRHIGILRPCKPISGSFLSLVLECQYVFEQATLCATGIAQKTVPLGGLRKFVLPLPPLAEQHRIVAKVDELMALCDRLEAARNEREARRDRLIAASLHRLNQPQDSGDAQADAAALADHARFHLHHLSRLSTRPGHIKPLRQTILNLAVRGKLVEQDPADEPAEKLLKRFAAKKLALKRETKDPRIKFSADASPENYPGELPIGWSVQSFENLFLFIDYRGNTPPKTSQGVPLITAKNVRMGVLNREPREFISAETLEKWMTRGTPRIGDLFFTTEAPLANVCLNEIDVPFALAQRIICLQPYESINTRFLMVALISDVMQALIDAQATGMTAKGIKAAKLKPLPIPLPPLAEQHRIVARVDELMALCDRLEASLSAQEGTSRRLLESVLHHALAPALEEVAA